MNRKSDLISSERSWWQRTVPVRIRHNSRLIFSSIFVLVITGLILGSFRINPIVFAQESQEQTSNSRFNIIGTVDLFDISTPHKIEMLVSPSDYQIMMNDYQHLGLKSWVPANITIDGTLIENIGIRLKEIQP